MTAGGEDARKASDSRKHQRIPYGKPRDQPFAGMGGCRSDGHQTERSSTSKDLEPVGIRLRLDRAGWSCSDPTMRAFLCEVDETGLRRLLSEDMIAGDGVRGYTRHRFARPTTVAWTLLDDGDAESIRSEVAAGHHEAACGLLLNRAIELLSLAAALPETTLPA